MGLLIHYSNMFLLNFILTSVGYLTNLLSTFISLKVSQARLKRVLTQIKHLSEPVKINSFSHYHQLVSQRFYFLPGAEEFRQYFEILFVKFSVILVSLFSISLCLRCSVFFSIKKMLWKSFMKKNLHMRYLSSTKRFEFLIIAWASLLSSERHSSFFHFAFFSFAFQSYRMGVPPGGA